MAGLPRLSADEYLCLCQLAADGLQGDTCSEALLLRLLERGLIETAFVALPVVPPRKRYRLTPLGAYLLQRHRHGYRD